MKSALDKYWGKHWRPGETIMIAYDFDDRIEWTGEIVSIDKDNLNKAQVKCSETGRMVEVQKGACYRLR